MPFMKTIDGREVDYKEIYEIGEPTDGSGIYSIRWKEEEAEVVGSELLKCLEQVEAES